MIAQRTMSRKKKSLLDIFAEVSTETTDTSEFLGSDLEKVFNETLKMGPRQIRVFCSFMHTLIEFMGKRGLYPDSMKFDKSFMGFGDKIRRIRKFHGLTLEEFAAIIHEHSSQISMVETGKRPVSAATLVRVCMAFHMNPQRLLSDWED